MVRTIFITLVLSYFGYSFLVYNYTARIAEPPELAKAGMDIWQSKNCQACHQLYGLGGYMGPDLTNIVSDSTKGAAYAAAFIKVGTARMPDLKLTDDEVNKLVVFLSWVDKSGRSRVAKDQVNWYGSYQIDKK